VLVDVEQVAGTLVTLAAKSFVEDFCLVCHLNSVVVEFPPSFILAVVYIHVIVSIFCESIVDHNCVQAVGILLALGVGLLNNFLECFDLGLQLVDFQLCQVLELLHDKLSLDNRLVIDVLSR
jgi:hypothetical protein